MILSTFLSVICFGGLSTFCGMNKSRDSAKAKSVNYGELNFNSSLSDRVNQVNAEGLGIEDKVEPNSKNFIISLWDSIIMFFFNRFFTLRVKYKGVCHYFSWGFNSGYEHISRVDILI